MSSLSKTTLNHSSLGSLVERNTVWWTQPSGGSFSNPDISFTNVSECPGFNRYLAIVPNITPSPPHVRRERLDVTPGLVFARVQKHLDQRALLDHPVHVIAPPRARDVGQELAALIHVPDDPRCRPQVRLHLTLQVEREVRVRVQVGEPVAPPRRRHATDVDPSVYVVERNLEPALLAGSAPRCCDVDQVAPAERFADRFLSSFHRNRRKPAKRSRIPSGGAVGPSPSPMP